MDVYRSKKFYFLPHIELKLSRIDMEIKNSVEKKQFRMAENLELRHRNGVDDNDFQKNYQILLNSDLIVDSGESLKAIFNKGSADTVSSGQLWSLALRNLIEDKRKMEKLGKPIKVMNIESRKGPNNLDFSSCNVIG